jgi:stage II sporulation SpoAA-like protein
MIERYEDMPAGIDAVRAVGTLTPEDYDDVVVPMIEAAVREGRRLRILCVVDETFTGLTPAAAWDDVKLGLRAMGNLDGCAVVSDLTWVREVTRLSAFFLPGQVRTFAAADRDAAVGWLEAMPDTVARVRLDREAGVVVADVSEPLRRSDVDAIAAEVDAWLGVHTELPGLVLHADTFPGWRNVQGLVSHLGFVRDHQRRIQRVALAVDGWPLDGAAWVAGALLHPDVRHFAAGDLDDAISWASAGQLTSSAV